MVVAAAANGGFMNNKRVFSSLIVLAIAAVIMGIYFFKNPVSKGTETPTFTEPGTTLEGADFTLAQEKIVDFEALSAFGLPMIVDYGSDSCIPCKAMAPVLETMNAQMQGKAFIKFVDVWKYTDAADNVPIQVIPTQVLVNADGTPFVPSDELAAKIEFSMYSSRETGEHVFTTHQGGMTEEEMRLILAEMGVQE